MQQAFECRRGGLNRWADMTVIPQARCSAPDSWMQFRRDKPGPKRAHYLCQFLPLGQYGNCLDNRHASLRERMGAVQALFVFDDLLCQVLLAHRRDYIVRELCPSPNLVDERIHVSSKRRLLLVGRLFAPPPLVQVAPAVNEFKHADQAFMRKSIIPGCDPTTEI
jgi:hypothetical protein